MFKKPLLWLAVTMAAIAILAAVSPAEQSLGPNVRVVYLHGAWVWVALIAFAAAGLMGAAGLVAGREPWQRWSVALGRTGLCFWLAYLPLSLWAMQTNWNGLFLAEPRWRVAVGFAIGGLLLQSGLYLLERPAWAAACNALFAAALFAALRLAEDVMHPGSPIFSSDATRIQIYFLALLALTLAAAWQVARWWCQLDLPA